MLKLNIHNYSEIISRLSPDQVENVKNAVFAEIAAGHYGFVNILGNEKQIESMHSLLNSLSEVADTLLVLGIGGSDLGGRAIQQALGEKSRWEVIFAGDTTDPIKLRGILEEIEWSKTIVNVVSKSGNTLETMAYYAFCKDESRKALGNDWKDHFIFTTDSDSGILHREGEKYNIIQLPVPDDVGGRFSVLSTVGLLPAVAMGVNAAELLAGGRAAVEDLIHHGENSLAAQIALYQFAHYLLEGRDISVMMPYSSSLNEFARWYRQLWAESLGKDSKGIMPIESFGPADQHSQLQFYVQGKDMSTFTFLKVLDYGVHFPIPSSEIPELDYMTGVDMAQIINIQQEATQSSLVEANKPCVTVEIPSLNEKNLGQMFVTWELAVVLLAELMQVNAFDQPGVESSKQKALATLTNLSKLKNDNS